MRNLADELNYLVSSARRISGVVVSIQGTEIVVATSKGGRTVSSTEKVLVNDRVILNDGLIESVLSRPASLPEFVV